MNPLKRMPHFDETFHKKSFPASAEAFGKSFTKKLVILLTSRFESVCAFNGFLECEFPDFGKLSRLGSLFLRSFGAPLRETPPEGLS